MTEAWTAAGALLAGYTLDLLLGDPRWLPHPVVGFGWLIAAGERRLNRGRGRFLKGALMALALTAGTFALVWSVEQQLARLHPGVQAVFLGLGVFFGLANRTLIQEGRAVFAALSRSLEEGRARLRWIVGRDTGCLDAQQVRTAVFETMSENLSDGVVAPLFYYALGGLPAMLAYKMVNTMDSMIGHRDARHLWFGKTAARLDDVLNWIPARLTALLLVLVSGSARGLEFAWRYGRAHASPNAGYPEAALAGILNLRFGGPLAYDGERVEKPWIGREPREIRDAEIEDVCRLNHAVAAAGVLLAVATIWIRAH